MSGKAMRKEPVVQAIAVTLSAAITVVVLNTVAGFCNFNSAQAQSGQGSQTYTYEGNKRMLGQR